MQSFAILLSTCCACFAQDKVLHFANEVEITSGGPVYSSQTDTYLSNQQPWANFGGDEILRVGNNPNNPQLYRAILRFDALRDFIPEVHSVLAASLTLKTIPSPSQSADLTVEVYAIQPANADWVSGDGVGSQVHGAATWNARALSNPLQTSPRWEDGDGMGDPGGGFEAAPLGSFTIARGEPATVRITGLEAIVQRWVQDPSANAGLLLKLDNESTESFGRIYGAKIALKDATLAPVLEVRVRK